MPYFLTKEHLCQSELNQFLRDLRAMKDERFYLIARLQSELGLNLSEVLALSWNDFDKDNQLLKVNKYTKLMRLDSIGRVVVRKRFLNKMEKAYKISKRLLLDIQDFKMFYEPEGNDEEIDLIFHENGKFLAEQTVMDTFDGVLEHQSLDLDPKTVLQKTHFILTEKGSIASPNVDLIPFKFHSVCWA